MSNIKGQFKAVQAWLLVCWKVRPISRIDPLQELLHISLGIVP
jgi:hypothetical protein